MPAPAPPTPLIRKLGIKPGFRVATVAAPTNYLALVAPLPDGVVVVADRLPPDLDLVHAFATSAAELERALPVWLTHIRPNGTIWVSWPKKASKRPTDVTEDVIRRCALPLGLVDVKVCAVDDVWSALKLVIRKQLRR